MVVEPGIIREVLAELIKQQALGRQLSMSKIAEALSEIVVRHAPLGHGSEVAWALWAHIALVIPLGSYELDAVEAMDDPVVALVTLDAAQRNLTPRASTSQNWNNAMTAAGLTDTNWLLGARSKLPLPFHASHGVVPIAMEARAVNADAGELLLRDDLLGLITTR
ncbi:MAG TPA: hypothetical protein VH062_08110, partial [Polyangiaceae bacterium]|nr:hypothetical protein [Polyangiaceae bacterium]